jgi:regulator of protease activity HflC (stomatin/prohibitin superfamily)
VFDKLIDLLVSVLHWFRFWAICGAEHEGCVTRFGHPVRDLKPGLNFIWPFVEDAVKADVRVWADVLPAQSLRTKDGVTMVVRLMVSHAVVDARTFAFKVFDANNNIQDVAAGELGSAVMAATAAEVYDGTVLKKVRRKVVTAAKAWGLEIHNVRFVDAVEAPAVRLFGAGNEPT